MRNDIGIIINVNGELSEEFLLEGLDAEQWTMFRDRITALILDEGEKHPMPEPPHDEPGLPECAHGFIGPCPDGCDFIVL